MIPQSPIKSINLNIERFFRSIFLSSLIFTTKKSTKNINRTFEILNLKSFLGPRRVKDPKALRAQIKDFEFRFCELSKLIVTKQISTAFRR